MTTEYSPFLGNIKATLEKNGFPTKRVALPLERMYEVAYEKSLNFNKALDLLDAEGIGHEKTSSKVIFFSRQAEPLDQAGGDAFDLSAMMAQASEILKTMSPEQLKEMEALYQNMSVEQKEEMMEKAKQMGLPKI